MADDPHHPASRDRMAFACACLGMAGLAAAIFIGPLFSPPAFDWIKHSTSEQAGQNMPGASIMQAGFLAYGLGVIAAVALAIGPRPWVRGALLVFGSGLLAAAAWSNAPIVEGLAVNWHEDWLHSVASGLVGAAFATACACALFAPQGSPRDLLAWAGLLISVAVPVAMFEIDAVRGLLQRSMFAFSCVFVMREFWPGWAAKAG